MARIKQWSAETRSRSLEIGSILQVMPSGSCEGEAFPAPNDQICISVAGEKFLAEFMDVSAVYLAISLVRGPTLFLEPVASGIPPAANGTRLEFPPPSGG